MTQLYTYKKERKIEIKLLKTTFKVLWINRSLLYTQNKLSWNHKLSGSEGISIIEEKSELLSTTMIHLALIKVTLYQLVKQNYADHEKIFQQVLLNKNLEFMIFFTKRTRATRVKLFLKDSSSDEVKNPKAKVSFAPEIIHVRMKCSEYEIIANRT